jgi:hypothetical protein
MKFGKKASGCPLLGRAAITTLLRFLQLLATQYTPWEAFYVNYKARFARPRLALQSAAAGRLCRTAL